MPIPTAQRAHFANIDDIEPLSSQDTACLEEIREVLARHGALERFGVSLLHEHFEVADDEILVETCDIEARTLVTTPMKRAELGEEAIIQTNWCLRSGD